MPSCSRRRGASSIQASPQLARLDEVNDFLERVGPTSDRIRPALESASNDGVASIQDLVLNEGKLRKNEGKLRKLGRYLSAAT
jgi:hypothetical protein